MEPTPCRRGLWTWAAVVALGLAGATAGFTGAAWAVSGGGYQPSQQDCSANADANNAGNPGTSEPAAEPGCHNVAINVEGGDGNTRYAEVGLDQLPNNGPAGTPTPLSLGYPGNDNSIHSGCAAVNTNGTGGGPGVGCGSGSGTGANATFDIQNTSKPLTLTPETGTPDTSGLQSLVMGGFRLYYGQDDNTDAGEHDGASGTNGTAGSVTGPSDGGGVGIFFLPAMASQTPTAYDPVPFAGAYEGACADGICEEATTQRQTVYQGCGANAQVQCSASQQGSSRDVYNYQGKTWDPYNCSSGDTTSEAPGPNGCGNHTMDWYRQQEAQNVYAEPGFQFYEDPDPQGSPALPVYPLPAVYVGTCGVVAGGGQQMNQNGIPSTPAAPSGTPVTNDAGQVAITPTGC
ncbi:MAG TPA: hypothetical protein VNF71_03790 [Acidimicrobiales bacterium]|nr:hypothetical protein [Acidimicrobiales bacterium]